MFNYTSIKINGYGGEPLGNTFLKQDSESQHLAILFPGLNYSVDMPLLYFPARMLTERGADVLLVETNYGRNPAYTRAPLEERLARVEADARAALEGALAQRSYQNFTLIGKSIGTRALGVLASDRRLASAKMIWETPLLTDARLVQQIRTGGQCGLFIIGTVDSFYQPETLSALATATCSHSLVIAEADHSMEIPGSFRASFQALQEILEAIETFLDR